MFDYLVLGYFVLDWVKNRILGAVFVNPLQNYSLFLN